MDSNQGTKDSSQDSKCTELDSHAHQLSPIADWGHTPTGLLTSVWPNLNSTLTVGNILQLIHFSNRTDRSNSPPSDATMGNDPSFPSMINDVSSIGNANHHPSSKSNPSDVLDVAVTNIAVTNKKDDDVSSIGNQLRLSAQSIIHSLAASVKDNLRRTLQHRQGSNAGSSAYGRIHLVLLGGINAPRNPPSHVSFTQPTVVHHFNRYGTPGNNTAPTADTTHASTTPRRTVDYPSFPSCHTSSMAFRSSDIDLLMRRNVKSTDLFGHTPAHVPVSPHATIHIGSPAYPLFLFSVRNQ